jgi:histidine triad (HIT) family protein
MATDYQGIRAQKKTPVADSGFGVEMPLTLPEMDPCYFCECVLAGPGGWNFVARDGEALILLNGRQYETGQCIVLPVRHAPTLLELSDEEGAAVMRAARRIATAMVEIFAPDGVLLYQNNGVAVGQEVPHFHLHVVPRRVVSHWEAGPPQLAAVMSGERAAYRDYAKITDEKLSAVAQLQERLRSGPVC